LDLKALIDAFRGPLIGLLASWGAPWAEAVELAEETFAEAWLNRESCRGRLDDTEVAGRWLRGVARNLYRNWARSRRRRTSRITFRDSESLSRVATPNEKETNEQLDSLRQAIERLPAPQREVVLMHYLEETTVSDVAALLSVSVKTVEGRLYQARRALRRMLDAKLSKTNLNVMLLWL